MGPRRAERLYKAAGGRLLTEEPRGGADRAGPESLRWDGLLTSIQVADWFEVAPPSITKAREPRDDGPPLLRPAKWENGYPLYDPAQPHNQERRMARACDERAPARERVRYTPTTTKGDSA